jgi:hypothetical protein
MLTIQPTVAHRPLCDALPRTCSHWTAVTQFRNRVRPNERFFVAAPRRASTNGRYSGSPTEKSDRKLADWNIKMIVASSSSYSCVLVADQNSPTSFLMFACFQVGNWANSSRVRPTTSCEWHKNDKNALKKLILRTSAATKTQSCPNRWCRGKIDRQ